VHTRTTHALPHTPAPSARFPPALLAEFPLPCSEPCPNPCPARWGCGAAAGIGAVARLAMGGTLQGAAAKGMGQGLGACAAGFKNFSACACLGNASLARTERRAVQRAMQRDGSRTLARRLSRSARAPSTGPAGAPPPQLHAEHRPASSARDGSRPGPAVPAAAGCASSAAWRCLSGSAGPQGRARAAVRQRVHRCALTRPSAAAGPQRHGAARAAQALEARAAAAVGEGAAGRGGAAAPAGGAGRGAAGAGCAAPAAAAGGAGGGGAAAGAVGERAAAAGGAGPGPGRRGGGAAAGAAAAAAGAGRRRRRRRRPVLRGVGAWGGPVGAALPTCQRLSKASAGKIARCQTRKSGALCTHAPRTHSHAPPTRRRAPHRLALSPIGRSRAPDRAPARAQAPSAPSNPRSAGRTAQRPPQPRVQAGRGPVTKPAGPRCPLAGNPRPASGADRGAAAARVIQRPCCPGRPGPQRPSWPSWPRWLPQRACWRRPRSRAAAPPASPASASECGALRLADRRPGRRH
jgi:hypothetical protein